jgi:hypothetical protein
LRDDFVVIYFLLKTKYFSRGWQECSLNEDIDDDDDEEVYLQIASDDEQDFHFSPTSLPSLQFRSRMF